MDSLRKRFAAVAAGRPVVVVVAGVLAVAVVGAALVVASTQASGSTAEAPSVRIAASSPAPTPLLVHVSGAVRSPGLVSLSAGARVVDAIAAAGGPTAAADQGAVNLAARVVDGQQIVVPKRGAPPSTARRSAAGAAGATISLSSATAEQLETLPRIGPALAARIIAYRDAHGGFSSVDDLGRVDGIGPKTLAGLRDLVAP